MPGLYRPMLLRMTSDGSYRIAFLMDGKLASDAIALSLRPRQQWPPTLGESILYRLSTREK